MLVALLAPATLPAAPVEPVAEGAAGRGEPVEQRFLADNLSVVTTPHGQSCVASARIDIAASSYDGADGAPVPFDRIVRSPAASVQAVLGAAEPGRASLGPAADGPGFRVQLKFSPRPGAPVALLLGSEGRRVDVTPALEASTDSLWIDGAVARDLLAAFRAGDAVRLEATSRDTGHRVADALPAPDLAALEACAATLDADAAPGPLADQVSLRFAASPDAATLATPEALRACGMAPADRPLHVGRLLSTTGFFAQVPTVLVAFDDEGRVERAYVPGILDADLSAEAGPAGAPATLRLSRAADGNLPDAPNDVTGCIGAHRVVACYDRDGLGNYNIAACAPLDGSTPGGAPLAGVPDVALAAAIPSASALVPRGTDGGGGSGASVPIADGGDVDAPLEPREPAGPGPEPGPEPGQEPGPGPGPGPSPGPEPEPPAPVEPTPIPLPAAGWLLLAALGLLVGLRRSA